MHIPIYVTPRDIENVTDMMCADRGRGSLRETNTMASGSGGNFTNDCSPIFSSDQTCDIILGVRRALAILSMLCCVVIVIIILLFKKYKFFSQRLILYLSVSAFFQAISYAMGDYHIVHKAEMGELEGVCIFQGVYNLYADWFSFLWVFCITLSIFTSALTFKSLERFERALIALNIILPAVICAFPFIEMSYGPAGLWCWISSERDGHPFKTGIILQFSLFYGPFWIGSIVMIAMLILAYCKIHQWAKKYKMLMFSQEQGENQKLVLWKEDIKPLVIFPWIYLAILIFPAMNRIRLAVGFDDPDHPANFFFWFMHSVTLTLHGTIYALIFACDKHTRSRLNLRHIQGGLNKQRAQTYVDAVAEEAEVEMSNASYSSHPYVELTEHT